MKTIEEAAREFSDKLNMSIEAKKMLTRTDFSFTFISGVEFAQRWIPVEEELPIAYETGGWDGKRSDLVLVKYADGDWTKARLYSGELDGHKFNDWYDENDYLINTITHFRPIELKP
ncbi:MAG: hypothetical protein KBD57_09870 [Bacteroidia bacterium]|nr:hypothetical protein [Bacteroidia bacterium]